MFIIAGLGNPTAQYAHTRHNVGFDTIDVLAEKYNISVNEGKFKALCGSGYIEGQKVLLLKPLTYMNLSGEAIRAAMDFYKIDPEEELIVLCDDINLDPGRIRIREKGSAGGHNGLKNIILHCGTDAFTRIKIGVGEKPKERDLADWVLARFPREEEETMAGAFKDAADAAALIVTGEIRKAQDLYNKKKEQV